MVNQSEFSRNPFSPYLTDFSDRDLEGFNLPTHYGFIDESGLNNGRHRAISMVSLEVASAYGIVREACLGVEKRWPSKREMHWVDVRDDGKSRVASQMVSLVSKLAARSFLRVDVLHWDTQDRHHTVCGRDDRENANDMARHLLNQVCGRRWPHSGDWVIHPDGGSLIDWESCAGRVRNKTIGVREAASDEVVLVQVADLFAGLATFAANRFDKLLASKLKGDHISNGDRAKLPVIQHLLESMAVHGVVLTSRRGLQTPPSHSGAPINFWPFNTPRGRGRAVRRGERQQLGHSESALSS